jgi:membrane protease YdiL (CAAX protease family)
MKAHPLIAFFAMAYAFAWLLWVPLLTLSQDGIGVLPFKAPALPIVISGGFMPAIAAVIVTALLDGRAGVGRLLRRCIQWRAGIQWYLLAIFLVPAAFLAVSVALGRIPLATAVGNSPMLLTLYPLLLVAQVILAGGLGEEPGWRGFALDRMQTKFGPLAASVRIGILQACWHIPLFFVGALSQAHFNFPLFVVMAIGFSIALTWVYNNTGGSLLLMMLMHEAEDTTSAISLRLAPQYLDRTAAYAIVFVTLALVIVILTRGTLSHEAAHGEAAQEAAPSARA